MAAQGCVTQQRRTCTLSLGASPSDSAQQLRSRYQKLALEAESAVRMFVQVDAAWKLLSDENTRRQYDQQRRARELKQDWPVDATISLEDMSWDQSDSMYTYACRCGGQFSVSEEDVEEATQRRREEEDTEERHHVVVGCDTCSLTVFIT
ncbi:dnaJ homolog subfamily C member 24-like, partial [Lampetra planeri]